MENFDFGNFFNNASSLGLQYIDKNYVNPKDENKTAKEKQAQKYEQIQQKTAPAPAAKSVNSMLIYGGIGLAALIGVVLIARR